MTLVFENILEPHGSAKGVCCCGMQAIAQNDFNHAEQWTQRRIQLKPPDVGADRCVCRCATDKRLV